MLVDLARNNLGRVCDFGPPSELLLRRTDSVRKRKVYEEVAHFLDIPVSKDF